MLIKIYYERVQFFDFNYINYECFVKLIINVRFLKFDFDFVIEHFSFINLNSVFLDKVDFLIFNINRFHLIVFNIQVREEL